jgi:hypothetical protein
MMNGWSKYNARLGNFGVLDRVLEMQSKVSFLECESMNEFWFDGC